MKSFEMRQARKVPAVKPSAALRPAGAVSALGAPRPATKLEFDPAMGIYRWTVKSKG